MARVGSADIDLLDKWFRDGDADAFRKLTTLHARMVYATCLRITRNPSQAEDLVQECFLRLAEKGGSPRTSLGVWLHAMATNRCLDRLRSDRRRTKREARYVREQGAATEPELDDLHEYVDAAIAELPEKLRAPLVAHFLEGQSHAVLAREMGVSRQTITHRIGKGIEAVRKTLKERGIVVGATHLTAVLLADAATAMPATLIAALGRLAVAGVSPKSATAVGGGFLAALAGLTIAKKAALVLTVAGLAAASALTVVNKDADSDAEVPSAESSGVEQVARVDSSANTGFESETGPSGRGTRPGGRGSSRRGGMFTYGWPGEGKPLVVRLYEKPGRLHTLETTTPFESVSIPLDTIGFALDSEDLPAYDYIVVVPGDQTDADVADYIDGIIHIWHRRDKSFGSFRIHGRRTPEYTLVTDALGTPLIGASVRVRAVSYKIENPFEVWLDWQSTDQFGKLRVPFVTGDGSHPGVRIHHRDYGTAEINWLSGDTLATWLVKPGSPAWERAFVGRVIDESGQPVADANVGIHHVQTPGGGAIQERGDGVVTDAQGRFAAYIPVRDSANRAVQEGTLIPPHSLYNYAIHPPASSSLVSKRSDGYNDEEVVITLVSGSFHTFSFENKRGRITDKDRLNTVIVSPPDRQPRIEYRWLQDGAFLADGLYKAQVHVENAARTAGEWIQFDPVEVGPDSPTELAFRLPSKGIVYTGQVVHGVTGSPMPGVVVMAGGGTKSEHVADFTPEDWALLDSAPANASVDSPTLEPLQSVYAFNAFARTDADGRYRLALRPGGSPGRVLVCARDYLPVSRGSASPSPSTDGVVEIRPLPLFPAATVALRITADDDRVQYVPRWRLSDPEPPAWAALLAKSRWKIDLHLNFDNGWRPVNESRQRLVPAGLPITLDFFLTGRFPELQPFEIPEPIQLAQGQFLDLGTFALERGFPVDVQIVDTAGVPVEGAPIHKNVGRGWGIAQITDGDGWARFYLGAGDVGRFAVLVYGDAASERVAHGEEYDPVVASVEFDMSEDAREDITFVMTISAENIARVLAE